MMLKKTEKLVITFHTTTQAMAMEKVCKSLSADGRLIPVPRIISAGCGLAWCANLESEEKLMLLMQENHLSYQGVHRCLV